MPAWSEFPWLNRKPNREIYAQAVREVEADLLRLALRLAHPDRELAQDLVQDAIVKGYSLYLEGRLVLGPAVRGWFARVIANDHRMKRRRDKFHVDIPITDGEGSGPMVVPWSTEGLPEEEALRSSRRDVLLRAIGNLPEDQRAVVWMADVEEYSYEDVAAVLAVPVGTVRSRLSRARLKLAQVLAHQSEVNP